MKKVFAVILTAGALLSFSMPGFAKCMRGSDWTKGGSIFYVCIHGDSFADRKTGRKVCEKIKGSSCNTATTFDSSCNGHCYDKDGQEHHSLSGY